MTIYNIPLNRPKIVCLCGSTKFKQAFESANRELTLQGFIVLTVGFFMHSDNSFTITSLQKEDLDLLHKSKIELADTVHILNVDGYIGNSTRSEIDYAESLGKPISYLVDTAL